MGCTVLSCITLKVLCYPSSFHLRHLLTIHLHNICTRQPCTMNPTNLPIKWRFQSACSRVQNMVQAHLEQKHLFEVIAPHTEWTLNICQLTNPRMMQRNVLDPLGLKTSKLWHVMLVMLFNPVCVDMLVLQCLCREVLQIHIDITLKKRWQKEGQSEIILCLLKRKSGGQSCVT